MREDREGGRETERDTHTETESARARARERQNESLTKRGGQGQENSITQMAELYRDQAWGRESKV